MRKVLGRKKRNEQHQWEEVFNNIEQYVSLSEVQEATAKAIENIQKTTNGKQVAYSWSGGKDSIVLASVCEQAGISNSMWAHTELEYPAFFSWCQEHKPKGCEAINVGYDLDWLNEHPNMLFPNEKDYQRWMVLYQRKAFTQYFFGGNLDMLLVGHRKADGNIVGENNVIAKRSGEVRFSPLADWSHEMLLAYIHYNKLDLPMIYQWKDGYKQGTHAWAGRQGMKNHEQGFGEVWDIDPQIVIKAATKIESAKKFLEGKM